MENNTKNSPIITIIKDTLQGLPDQENIDEILNLPVCVIHVRPKTNIVSYERDILLAITQSYTISQFTLPQYLYMANITGTLFEQNQLVINHNPVRYEFAVYGKELLGRYPEMVERFENKFKTKFDDAKIIGSFEALKIMNVSPKDLMQKLVPEENYIKMYGQTIKKIDDYFVINYDVPGIKDQFDSKNYQDQTDDKQANIFVLAFRFMPDIQFLNIKEALLNQFRESKRIKLTIDEMKSGVRWFDKLNNICHVSANHLIAMFDLFDLYYKRKIIDNYVRGLQDSDLSIDDIPITEMDQLQKVSFHLSPLGKMLMDTGVSNHQLLILKCNPIVKIKLKNGGTQLINILDKTNGKNLIECRDLILSIDW